MRSNPLPAGDRRYRLDAREESPPLENDAVRNAES
jgi:hypothetical protein